MIKEPHEPGRSVAPMTATDLGLRNTFNCSLADTAIFLSHVSSTLVFPSPFLVHRTGY
jgi:hypothetical protein